MRNSMPKVLSLLFISLLLGCDGGQSATTTVPSAPAGARRDGIGVAILVDRSGSMGDKVKDFDGVRRDKEDVAKRAIIAVIQRCETFVKTNTKQTLEVGVFQFDRDTEVVVPFAAPNVAAMKAKIDTIYPNGSTAIGDGVIKAKMALDQTGLKNRHIVVITDGANTDGSDPAVVAKDYQKLTGDEKLNVYLVAFDVDSKVFRVFKDAGWVVLSASDAPQLQQSLDQLLGENILLER